jgi:hypothetical protein
LDGRDEDIWRESKLGSTPTYPQSKLTSNLDDYGKKRSVTARVCGARRQREAPT